MLRNGNPNLSFIYLKGDFEVIESRLKARKGHFFKTQMLVTQFETLQEPGADENDVLSSISTSHWKAWSPAPSR
jgi:gluconokinase